MRKVLLAGKEEACCPISATGKRTTQEHTAVVHKTIFTETRYSSREPWRIPRTNAVVDHGIRAEVFNIERFLKLGIGLGKDLTFPWEDETIAILVGPLNNFLIIGIVVKNLNQDRDLALRGRYPLQRRVKLDEMLSIIPQLTEVTLPVVSDEISVSRGLHGLDRDAIACIRIDIVHPATLQ